MANDQATSKGAYSVAEFCKSFGSFTRPHFYRLMRIGKGPRIFKIGKRTLISHEAACEWVRRMEHETASEAEA